MNTLLFIAGIGIGSGLTSVALCALFCSIKNKLSVNAEEHLKETRKTNAASIAALEERNRIGAEQVAVLKTIETAIMENCIP